MRRSLLALPVLVAAVAGCAKTEPAPHAPAPAGHGAVMTAAIAAEPTAEEIAGLFDLWNETLQMGSAHDMAMLYAEDGVLLPTVSNAVRSNRPEITDYFVHFQALSPRGQINEQYIQILDANTAMNSGVYTFDVLRDGAPDFVVARYSFTYEKIDGRWQIKTHHSSAMPEAMSGRPAALAERRGGRVHAASFIPAAHAATTHAAPGHASAAHAAKPAAAGH